MENNNTNIVGTVDMASNPTHVLPSSDSTDATNTDEQEKDLFSDTQESKESKKQEKGHEAEDNKKTSTADGQETEKKTQSKEENRKYAEKRREQERREKELKEIEEKAYRRGLVEAVGGRNPYTNTDIKDDIDVDVYLTMREIEKAGLDPIADYHAYVANKQRAERARNKVNQPSEEWLENDARQFMQKYSDVDFSSLMEDKRFLKFAEGKIGNLSLTKIYEDYNSFVSEFETEADKRARFAVARSQSTPGSVEAGHSKTDEYYTWEQLKKLTVEEYNKNQEKAEKSYQYHLKHGTYQKEK